VTVTSPESMLPLASVVNFALGRPVATQNLGNGASSALQSPTQEEVTYGVTWDQPATLHSQRHHRLLSSISIPTTGTGRRASPAARHGRFLSTLNRTCSLLWGIHRD
jgi:hypothetical protein